MCYERDALWALPALLPLQVFVQTNDFEADRIVMKRVSEQITSPPSWHLYPLTPKRVL